MAKVKLKPKTPVKPKPKKKVRPRRTTIDESNQRELTQSELITRFVLDL